MIYSSVMITGQKFFKMRNKWKRETGKKRERKRKKLYH